MRGVSITTDAHVRNTKVIQLSFIWKQKSVKRCVRNAEMSNGVGDALFENQAPVSQKVKPPEAVPLPLRAF